MRISNFFCPTLKETPIEAQIVSHRLMLRAGMIIQTASGIYSWLPLGLRVLNKVADIIRKEQENIGSTELLMSTIQPVELWEESGRENSYGEELLRFDDRRGRRLLYSPTNEEQVVDIFRRHVRSYKDLPKVFYQIQWKFRDELRPRFGVMRGREFYMKDAYSFDINLEQAKITYKNMFNAYVKTFQKMGLTPIPVKADSGAIGGDMSHEFHVLASTGESSLYYDKQIHSKMNNLQDAFDELSGIYAVADDQYDANQCPIAKENLCQSRGIEVGHIFNFGTKYTKAMNVTISDSQGQQTYPEMGSYGMGVSRLVGAIIEANHDDNGIIWPLPVAPYHISLINISVSNDECIKAADEIYNCLISKGVEVLYDDRNERAGLKMMDADLIGLPYQIVVGAKSLENKNVEIKNRKTGEQLYIHIDNVLDVVVPMLEKELNSFKN